MESSPDETDELGFEARLKSLVGRSFSKQVLFSSEDIGTFAALVGDTNPVHHDVNAAAAASFDTVVASGTHTLSVMLAVVPDYFSNWGPSVGLGASVRMLKAVRANERAQAEWTISNVREVPKLKGWVMDLQGKLIRADGVTAMTAAADVLFWDPKSSKANNQVRD